MHAKSPRVEVIVLNWNGRTDSLECLSSLTKIDYPNFAITFVDNGSSDDSISAVRERFPAIHVLDNRANLGFAEGNNRGIKHAVEAGAHFVLLLNNDTVVDPHLLSTLVSAAQQFTSGAVFGPKIYYYSDPARIWYAGGYWDRATLSFGEYGAGAIDVGQFDQQGETEWVIGCAMFIRVDVFRAVGMLEPTYFLNNEEIDFCCRVRRAGYSCVFVPDAKVWHKISASFSGEHSPLKTYFSARNRLLWAKRNAAPSVRARIYARSLGTMLRRTVIAAACNAMRPTKSARQWWWGVQEPIADPVNLAYTRGVMDFWLHRFGASPPRIAELNARWSSARAIR